MKKIAMISGWAVALVLAVVVAVLALEMPPSGGKNFRFTVINGEVVENFTAQSNVVVIENGKLIINSIGGNDPATALDGKRIEIR